VARLEFDPWSTDFVAFPYQAYAELRNHYPVCYFPPTDQWLVSRHEDVAHVLRDRRVGRSYLHVANHGDMGRPEPASHLEPFLKLVGDGMLDREPPDHTRLRRLVSAAFTPRRIDELSPRIQRIADDCVDQLLDAGSDGGPVDLKAIVAEPLPVTVIAEMLGIPLADRHLLRPWSADMCSMYELRPTPEAEERAVRASIEFTDYLRALARDRRHHDTGDDLLTALSRVVESGDRLTEDEMIGTCALLLNAGHEATVNVTGNGWLALFHSPDQLVRLRRDPSLLPYAMEELMRFDTPLQVFERWALDDIDIAGQRIPRGAEIALLYGSANHDPLIFDDPERLDIGRVKNPHISFGGGIHGCLAAVLARKELNTVFATLLRRVPALALSTEPRWTSNYVIRGLEQLLVTW
jgi:cytochrome P450